MKKILGSRKFIVTIAGVITVVANDYFNLGLNKETVISMVTMISTYVIGQGYVDGKKEMGK